MLRCRGQLARWTLRGVLLVGGAFGVWGLHEAAADDLAQAVAPAPSGVLGDLLGAGEATLGASLAHAPYSLATETVSGRIGTEVTSASWGKLAGAEAAVRAPTGERSAMQAPTGGAVVAAAAHAPATAVETLSPVTRPVTGLASSVVEEVAGTGLLKPVGDVVRPVTEPIVDVLPPALAPVLDLVQPVIVAPAMPATPPGHSAIVTPQPATGSPAPAAVPRPAPPMVAIHPQASSWAPKPGPAGTDKPSKAADITQVRLPGEPGDPSGVTPTAPVDGVGSGHAAGGTGIPAGAEPHSWAPSLQLLGYCGSRCDELVNRSDQPDTRPA